MKYSDDDKPNNNVAQADKVCVNCRHMVKAWDWDGIKSFVFDSDKQYHYMCSWNREATKEINPVTGRVTVQQSSLKYCFSMREYGGMCDEHGIRWQPSVEWSAKKENTFKAISSLSEIQ